MVNVSGQLHVTDFLVKAEQILLDFGIHGGLRIAIRDLHFSLES
jgi:hypothetical protein